MNRITLLLILAVACSSLSSAQEVDLPGAASIRIGWLLTAGEGYVDRPVVEGAGAYRVLSGDGESPTVYATGSAAVSIGDAFAERTLWSFRFAAGSEILFPVGPVYLATFAQGGYLTSLKEDERHGVYGRFGAGVRIESGRLMYSVDPVSVTILPLADNSGADASRLAIEVGVIRIGRKL